MHSCRPTGEDVLKGILSGLSDHLQEGEVCQIVSRFLHRETMDYRDWVGQFCPADQFSFLLIHTKLRYIFTLTNLEKTAWSVDSRHTHQLYKLYRREMISRESFGVLTLRRVGRIKESQTVTMDFDHWDPVERLEPRVLEYIDT